MNITQLGSYLSLIFRPLLLEPAENGLRESVRFSHRHAAPSIVRSANEITLELSDEVQKNFPATARPIPYFTGPLPLSALQTLSTDAFCSLDPLHHQREVDAGVGQLQSTGRTPLQQTPELQFFRNISPFVRQVHGFHWPKEVVRPLYSLKQKVDRRKPHIQKLLLKAARFFEQLAARL